MLPRGLLFGFLVSLTLPLLLSAWGWGPTVLPVSLAPGAHRPVRGCPHRPPETPGSAGRASRPGLLGGLLSPGEGREVGFSPGLCACAPVPSVQGCPAHSMSPASPQGTLIQHLKEHVLHGNMDSSDTLLYYTTVSRACVSGGCLLPSASLPSLALLPSGWMRFSRGFCAGAFTCASRAGLPGAQGSL